MAQIIYFCYRDDFYLASNTRPDVSFDVHQCGRFTHSTNASHESAVKRICWYLQGTKDNDLVFNPSNKLVVDFYADAYFTGMWVHENPQNPICDTSITVFAVKFSKILLLWVSKIQTYISIYTLHFKYVELSNSIRALLPLKIIIKKVIVNLVIDSKKLKFVSISTFYEENNGAIVVSTTPSMNPT